MTDKIDPYKWCDHQARKLTANYLPRVLAPAHPEYKAFSRKVEQRFAAALRLAITITHPPAKTP